MATKVETNEDESFIILDSSPSISMDIKDMKCNGVGPTSIEPGPLDKSQIEDAMKDLSLEASSAYKAHFKLGDCPSPASMMVASTIITDDKSTEELQKRFGELLDENVVLKETLKQNNDSMKEQFLLIASCQEDMMKTHLMHKEKFDETKELIEKLRVENKKLKQDLSALAQSCASAVNDETGEAKNGPSSALEFVTSPEDDTVDKLTSQLELVEKQRRQVITENEKLTWQKESLEHIVDATTKERDDLKEKLKLAELQLLNKSSEYAVEIENLKFTIEQLEAKLKSISASPEELALRDVTIKQLEEKVSSLQNELKNAQLKILEAENVKLEFAKYKSGMNDLLKINKENLQDLHNRLKEATTTVFQPVRISVSAEPNSSTDYNGLTSSIKLYDRTLKHLSELLNKLTHGLSDTLMESLGIILSLSDLRLERSTLEQFKAAVLSLKQQIETQHCNALTNIGLVRGTLTIFEGIFKDYKEMIEKYVALQNSKPSTNVEALTAALVARGQELQALETELDRIKADNEDRELLRAQLDLYRSDFEAERQSREKMASEKDTILTDLRKTQKRNEELTQQLEEVRRLNSSVYATATSKRNPKTPSRPASSGSGPASGSASAVSPPTATIYTCPKCMRFSCAQYKVMEDHFDFCLDDF